MARIACPADIGAARPAPEIAPAIAVTVTAPARPGAGAVSQTDQAETGLLETTRSSGPPGMPIIGAVGYLPISSDFTQAGEPGLPVASRAEVRFSAGCSRPSMRAYSAPVSRLPTISDCPASPAGLRTLSNAIQPHPRMTKTSDSARAACCLRSSCFMRTENRVIAARSRRL